MSVVERTVCKRMDTIQKLIEEAEQQRLVARLEESPWLFTGCMDGRTYVPELVRMVVDFYSSLGGILDHGRPEFRESFERQLEMCCQKGKQLRFVSTYHYSRGVRELGCAGHRFEKADGFRTANRQARQAKDRYGTAVSAFVMGVETDRDALILHGDTGQVVDLGDLEQSERSDLNRVLGELYPDRVQEALVLADVVEGNVQHRVMTVSTTKSARKTDHQEKRILLGMPEQIAWAQSLNGALSLSPIVPHPQLERAIEVAGMIWYDNLRSCRIPQDQQDEMALVVVGRDKSEASYLWATAHQKLDECLPRHFHYRELVGVLDSETREFTVCHQG